jgi:hypothetical protein
LQAVGVMAEQIALDEDASHGRGARGLQACCLQQLTRMAAQGLG